MKVSLVGFLGCGETGLVDTVVDLVVGPFVGFVYLGEKILGDEVDLSVLWLDEVVKLIPINTILSSSYSS